MCSPATGATIDSGAETSFAQALGMPVMLSMKTKAKRSTKDWVELLEGYRPTSSEEIGASARPWANWAPLTPVPARL